MMISESAMMSPREPGTRIMVGADEELTTTGILKPRGRRRGIGSAQVGVKIYKLEGGSASMQSASSYLRITRENWPENLGRGS